MAMHRLVMPMFAAKYQQENLFNDRIAVLMQYLEELFRALPGAKLQQEYCADTCRKEHESLFADALRYYLTEFLCLDKNGVAVPDPSKELKTKLMDYVADQIMLPVHSPSDEASGDWALMYQAQRMSSAQAFDDAEFFRTMNRNIQRTVVKFSTHAIKYCQQPAQSFVLFVRLSSAEWEGAFQVILQRLASDLSLQQKLGTYGFRFIQSSTSLPVAAKERIALDQMQTVLLASRREVQLEPVLQPLEWSLFMTGIACAQDEMKVMEVIARLASRWYRRSAAGSAPQDAISTYAEICRGIKLLSEVSTAKTATTAAGVCQVGGHGRLHRQSLRGADHAPCIYPGNTHYCNHLATLHLLG